VSAHVGLYYYDRRPLGRASSEHAEQCLRDSGLEQGSELLAPGLLMMHRGLAGAPEDARDRQPIVKNDIATLAWCGRLDNRDDQLVQLARDMGADRSDAAIALAAYTKWGTPAFGKLLGDWTLALLDKASEELVLASDPMGARALYYHVGSECITWGTALGAVALLTGRERRLCKQFLIGMLTLGKPPRLTPYEGIESLTPGLALTIGRAGCASVQPFYTLRPHALSADRDEAADELRRVFMLSVRDRLRGRTVWSQLSGGLDSSAVVCMADHLRRSGDVETRELHTMSLIDPRSPESGDVPFIEVVERFTECPPHHYDPGVDRELWSLNWITPLMPGAAELATRRDMLATDARVIMTGSMGDSIMANFTTFDGAVVEPLLQWRLLTALGAAIAWAKSAKHTLWNVLAEARLSFHSTRAHERAEMRTTLQRIASRTVPSGVLLRDAFSLRPEATDDVFALYDHTEAEHLDYPNPVKRSIVAAVRRRVLSGAFRTAEALPGIHYAHPFVDRRVVELILGLPNTVLCGPGKPRALMKQAFAGFMPTRVLNRFSKGYATPTNLRRFRSRDLPVLRLGDSRLESLGLIDSEHLSRRLQRVTTGAVRDTGNLAALAVAEYWLREREEWLRQTRTQEMQLMH
jgi:asparagine synthase (glutamine-hydrolysing)